VPDRTPRQPSPEVITPTPESPASETRGDKARENKKLGTAIVILFILIGLGISTVYFLHRAFKEQREY